jgi:cell division cycle 20-like protein 1 (cofactor of APC complex)
VLDAPSLQDDFYLNLLDWSSLNFISIGLENAVYIWSACNSKVNKLCELPDNQLICSLAWSPQGNHLSVGNTSGQIQIYDINKSKLLKTIDAHSSRVGSLAWDGYLLGSGSRDRSVMVRDLRNPNSVVHSFIGHKQEICGLRWSFDEQFLSSGGNDNKLFIWSLKTGGELVKFSQHNAAVKALGWSPHQYNILASGGGTADRTIRYWNMHTLTQQDCIDTGSQVCNLMFSKTSNEIVSTHGYSLNQIIVWKYPSLKKVATLTGHTSRVLYLSMSPCGQNVVTGAGDETLRFWNLFPNNKIKEINGINSSTLYANVDLR